MRLGIAEEDADPYTKQSLNGSFKKPASVASFHTTSSTSTKFIPTSKRVYKVLKDYATKLVDINLFTHILEDWVLEKLYSDHRPFGSPFRIDEVQALDFALEGVLFQQLFRMPFNSDNVKVDKYLALEDFLRTVADGLWHTFWHKSKRLPASVSCSFYPGSKFYTVDRAVSRGKVAGLSGAALMSRSNRVHWDDVVQFVLFKENIITMRRNNEPGISSAVVCEALLYGVYILLSRSLSKYDSVDSDTVFILVVDSKFGGVVKLRGNLGNLEVDLSNPYQSMVEWLKCHAEISISHADQIWNQLGNANWRDLGTLHLILAAFHSIVQWNGPPRKTIASLAAHHSLCLQERCPPLLVNDDSALVPDVNGEIIHHRNRNSSCLQLNRGEILLLEDLNNGQKAFQIEDSHEVSACSYTAVALDNPNKPLIVYVGAHPSRLEPSWEDMSLWYQVQRQTKVLNILKEQGISSKYLPEIVASGRILHSGPCEKQSPKGLCHHPWCGAPMLVTYPVGESLSTILSAEEAIRCCHNCLTALSSAKMANIQHGDICPDSIIRVVDNKGSVSYTLVSWGRAVMEERDSPAINLQFSSAYALQHRKLCPSSDAESLIYLIYFICGGTMQGQDSIESALEWKQRSWAKRLIQHHLGQVSPLLKAFADYVNSLCGTPYPVDYDVWIKRLSKGVDCSVGRGKMIQEFLWTDESSQTSSC